MTYLWLVPVILALGGILSSRARSKLKKSLGARLTPFLVQSVSVRKRRFKVFLEVLVIVCFVIAMARPQMGSSLQEVKSEGIEIMLLVDVSKSMLVEDNKPNRLETVKIEIKKLLDHLTGDKVGLVVFAGSAFLVSPLTTDYSAIKLFLDSLSTDSVSHQGTEIRPALEEAEAAFRRGGVGEDEGVAVTRVILIASDGEDHDKGALERAKELFKKGFRIFAMGIGTEQGAPVPVRDEFGYLKGYLKDESGKVVNSRHRGDFLTELSTSAGGGYYHASSSNVVSQLKSQLERLQKAQFESTLATEYDERYQLILLLGLLLGLLELLLGERRATKQWTGRFQSLSVPMLILLTSVPAISAVSPEIIKRNNQAAKELQDKNSYSAYKELIDLLAVAPFQPEIRLNLAYSYEVNEEWDKAVAEYKSVVSMTEDMLFKFQALFNAARVRGEQKKYDEALSLYQEALKIDPKSMAVKTNIELLLSRQQNQENSDQEKSEDNKDEKKDEDKKGKDQKGQNSKDQKKDPGEEKKEDEEQKKKDDGAERPNEPKEIKGGKKTAKPFKSEEISEKDVRNILEELKRQEEKNRAKVLEKQPKENFSGPDW